MTEDTSQGWTVVRPPDTEPDGSLDYGGSSMIIADPHGRRYEVIVPDICEASDRA